MIEWLHVFLLTHLGISAEMFDHLYHLLCNDEQKIFLDHRPSKLVIF